MVEWYSDVGLMNFLGLKGHDQCRVGDLWLNS